jgi:cell division protein FtsW (lipid II flippase)
MGWYFKLLTYCFRFFGLLICIWTVIFMFAMSLDQLDEETNWYNQSILEYVFCMFVLVAVFILGKSILGNKYFFRKND